MDEPINIENKKQNRQKPPLSRRRIACEILAGTATGLAVAYPVAYVIGASVDKGCFGGIVALSNISLVFPPVYGLGSTVGVYLLGTRGKQTGSFLITLIGGFLGGLIMYLTIPLALSLSTSLRHSTSYFIIGIARIVRWVLGVLILFIPPIIATIGFNRTRRYKKPLCVLKGI